LRIRDYTVLLVPDHTSKVHRVRLTSKRILTLSISAGAIALLFAVFTIGYFYNLHNGGKLARVQTEN